MNKATHGGSFLSRTLVLIYGVVSYFIGVAGLLCIISVLTTLMPFGFLRPPVTSAPIIWNLALVAIWGFVHSVMARDRFKNLLTKLLPEPAERPTYVLVAGLSSILLMGYWQPIPGVIWAVTNSTAAALIWAICAAGWIYLLAATFAINHFDLFGLRQVYLNFIRQPRAPLRFVKRAMYRFSRHPIQTGVLIGIWATPVMSATHLTLSLGFTAYIFIGLWFEEKDLVRDIGAPYQQYRQEAGLLGPRIFKRG